MVRSIPQLLLTGLAALVFGFAGAAAFWWSGLGGSETRDYLLAHPEILSEMAEGLQQREAEERLAGVADEVARPFPGAVLGNPEGSVTLVEFSDYGCTYCRQSVADVKALVAADPDLRVVVREWPIFEGSETAARMALAAAKQGKYAAFHDAMFERGPPSEASVAEAARAAGVDVDEARIAMRSPEVEFELAKNLELARQLRFDGTPSWVAGKRLYFGAVGRDKLAEAVAAAKES